MLSEPGYKSSSSVHLAQASNLLMQQQGNINPFPVTDLNLNVALAMAAHSPLMEACCYPKS